MIKLFKFLRPFRRSIIVILVLVFAQTIAQLYLPNLMASIVDTGIARGDTGYIIRTGGWMLVVAAGSIAAAVLAGLFSSRVSMGFGRDLRRAVFTHVQDFSLRELDHIGTPSLITRTTNDVTQVQMVTMFILQVLAGAPLTAIGGVVMALSQDRKLTWVLVVVIPILATVITLVATRAVPLFRAMQAKIDRINLVMREGLTGIRVIRAFDRVDNERSRFESANSDLTGTAIRVNKLMAVMMPTMMLIMNLTSVSIIWFGALRIDAGEMQVGNLMAFIQYATQILFSVLMLSMLLVMLPRAAASGQRINQVLEVVPQIAEPEAPQTGDGRRGHLEFRDVVFRYPGAEQPVLSNLSFTAKPGEVTAILGGTGSGKSTLVNLVPRFYDIESGTILIDGADIRTLRQEDLRSRIGCVPQRASLFTGTIADNIRFGKEDATDAEVAHAAEVAQAKEFILAMEDGYESVVSQGGTNLSGGQKQRLAIARAIVRKPEIYLFDDTFSALDFRTEARLRAGLTGETADSTVLIVAQRVTSVMDADRIIVLDEGRAAGIGTHRELMNDCSVYREIVASQLSEEEQA